MFGARLSPKRQRCSPVAERRKDSPIISPVVPVGRNDQDAMDLFSYLLRNRIVFIGSFIDFDVSTQVVGALLALEYLDENEDIKVYINCPGGSIYAILGIVDALLAIKPDVSTVVFGISGGNTSLILAAGTKGKRYSMANARIGLNQPAGYVNGSSVEAGITARELNRSLKVVNEFYSRFSGQSREVMEKETNRENFLSPQQAIDLGLIDGTV
eukprot:evm.model.scf_2479.1 EVM.evm.TU.scf_2479.1   scf_2479:14765-20550(+)